jgi:putative Holliday junction resolvase
MRVVGVDVGTRRIGLAVSDASATLARPWKTIAAGPTPDASLAVVRVALDDLQRELSSDSSAGDAITAIVVGLPQRLGGGDTHATAVVRALADRLRTAFALPVHFQDERLSSHEADQRLGVGERDWRKRKAKLDAAAAAVILQDFLDGQMR